MTPTTVPVYLSKSGPPTPTTTVVISFGSALHVPYIIEWQAKDLPLFPAGADTTTFTPSSSLSTLPTTSRLSAPPDTSRGASGSSRTTAGDGPGTGAATSSSSRLSAGEIAGIAISAIIAMLLIVAIMLLVFVLRRRRQVPEKAGPEKKTGPTELPNNASIKGELPDSSRRELEGSSRPPAAELEATAVDSSPDTEKGTSTTVAPVAESM
jgi:hypothetical protein